MVCKGCGRELAETDRFCIECGTVVQAPIQNYTGRTTIRRRKRKLLIPVLAVIAAVVIAAAALLPGIILGDAGRLLKAALKSFNAWKDSSVLDVQAISELEEQRELSGEYQLWLEDMPEQSQLEGFGIRALFDYSRPQGKLGVTLAPTYGYADLFHAKMFMQDMDMYFGSPELTKDVYYLIHADQFSRELQAIGVDTTKFDSTRKCAIELTNALKRAGAKAGTEAGKLVNVVLDAKDRITITRGEKEEIQVNGYALKADVYDIVIPQTVVSSALDVVQALWLDQSGRDNLVELFRCLDMDRQTPEEVEASLKKLTDQHQAFFDLIRNALATQGDLKIQAHTSGGYLVRVAFSLKVEAVTVDVAVELGGGKNYVDNLSLKVTAGNIKLLELISKGDHAGKNGPCTDRTRLSIQDTEIFQWDLRYAQNSARDDLTWTVYVGNTSVELKGWVKPDKHEYTVHLNEVNVVKAGQDVGACGMELQLGLYLPEKIDTSNHVVLAEMSAEERTAASADLTQNVMEWLGWVRQNFPELVSMLMF